MHVANGNHLHNFAGSRKELFLTLQSNLILGPL